ncbi:hypothetical protein [Paraburkholderia sp. BL6665CI2N2]|uniref:hypothetical protein n=1 Tax=Paraburkholderia sp. BL6665CI2N2 TaxID=1938806 RepID=UPI001FB90FAB|nr:hypothetical protein [Paraburkholderia sp. BL6665CI2N2]
MTPLTKHYEAPLTPLERVLRSPSIPEPTKRRLRARFRALDPLDLLRRMREAQQRVAQCSASGTASEETQTAGPIPLPLADFLASLGTAWHDGEVRATHPRKARVAHTWRSREDPFEHTWPTIQQWLESEPGITARKLHERVVAMAPAMYSGSPAAHPAAPSEGMALEPREGTGDQDTRWCGRCEGWRRYAAPAFTAKQSIATITRE